MYNPILDEPLPEILRALARHSDGEAAVFFRLPVHVREHAADLEQRNVIILAADVVAQRMDEAGQQARAQHVHVAAQRLGERHDVGFIDAAHFGFGNQRLALGFVQAKSGQNATRLGDLVVDRIKRVRAKRPARRGAGNFINAVKPTDFLDQIHFAFHVHAPRGHAERRLTGLLRNGFQTELVQIRNLVGVRDTDTEQIFRVREM